MPATSGDGKGPREHPVHSKVVSRQWCSSYLPSSLQGLQCILLLCIYRINYFPSPAALPSLIGFDATLWSAIKLRAAPCSAKGALGRALYSPQRLCVVQRKAFLQKFTIKIYFVWVEFESVLLREVVRLCSYKIRIITADHHCSL